MVAPDLSTQVSDFVHHGNQLDKNEEALVRACVLFDNRKAKIGINPRGSMAKIFP
jgi:hypothetical protein